MDFTTIVDLLSRFAPLGLLISTTVILISIFSYHLYRKKGGTFIIKKKQFVSAFLILGWTGTMLGLTTLSRTANSIGIINLNFLGSYLDAWDYWSLREFQLIVFNILVFVPLGFLLPILSNKLRKFLPVLLISFLTTVAIEVLQLITHRGVFDLDDIFHNTIGGIMGYFLIICILKISAEKKITFVPLVKVFILPVLFTMIFSVAFIVYDAKELGNLALTPFVSQNMDNVTVIFEMDLTEETTSVPLYKSDRIHNDSFAKKSAGILRDIYSLSQIRDFRQDYDYISALYSDKASNIYKFVYSPSNGSWNFHSTTEEPLFDQGKSELMSLKDSFEEWLFENSLLSEDATFIIQYKNKLRWSIKTLFPLVEKHNFDSGYITIKPAASGDIPVDISYSMHQNFYVRNIPIISQKEASTLILDGKFKVDTPLQDGDTLYVTSCTLIHIYDTKGFLIPVYQFGVRVNDNLWYTKIPAMDTN